MTTQRRTHSLQPVTTATPDANALEFFARVAAAGGFAAAARQLGQTRAAVSRRVAQVESQVGGPLFVRSTRSFGLTERGRRLLGRARAVAEAAEAARSALRQRAAGSADSVLGGTLRLTSVPMFGQSVLGPLLAAFQGRHPGLHIEMRFTARRIDLVREDVDVAFRLTERPPEDCIAQPVLPFVVRAYAAPQALPALPRPAALAQQRCLVLGPPGEEATLTWLHDKGHRRETVKLHPAVLADDMGSLVAVARAGGGVVFAPDFCVREDLQAGRLVDVLPGWRLPVPEGALVQAITLPLSLTSPAARALVDFVRQALAAPA